LVRFFKDSKPSLLKPTGSKLEQQLKDTQAIWNGQNSALAYAHSGNLKISKTFRTGFSNQLQDHSKQARNRPVKREIGQ
jgi:hypothetical protein